MNETVDYKLRITKRASRISLRYDQRGLRIVSPHKLSEKQARELIQRHYDWILKQKQDYASITSKLTDGAEITIFGDSEKIKYALAESAPRVRESGEFLIVSGPQGTHDKALGRWMRRTAKAGIIARVEELAAINGFTYQNVTVRDQVTRWGSCSSEKNLSFSWRLMLAPLEVLDYVVIHELAHTKQMNHSPAFWAIVAKSFPQYKQIKRWLRTEGRALHQY